MNKIERMRGIRLYHANAKGTGGALRITVRAANKYEDGAVFLTFANQLTIGDPAHGAPVRWDTEGRQTIRLDFVELSEVMQVFHGETESIRDGKGIYHRVAAMKTTKALKFRHLIDPIPGYHFELFTTTENGEETRHQFYMTPPESLGVCEALSTALYSIAFGDPTASDHASDE